MDLETIRFYYHIEPLEFWGVKPPLNMASNTTEPIESTNLWAGILWTRFNSKEGHLPDDVHPFRQKNKHRPSNRYSTCTRFFPLEKFLTPAIREGWNPQHWLLDQKFIFAISLKILRFLKFPPDDGRRPKATRLLTGSSRFLLAGKMLTARPSSMGGRSTILSNREGSNENVKRK